MALVEYIDTGRYFDDASPNYSPEVRSLLDSLRFEESTQDSPLFSAAEGYRGNFTRDSIISFLLTGDTVHLKAQLEYSAQHQGQEPNPITGQEVGKMHHEYPEVIMENGLSTAYNACDTTALFLLGMAAIKKSGNHEFTRAYSPHIGKAVDYILRHLSDNIFEEDPRFSLAKNYGLKVTNWKDSELNDAHRNSPTYPVRYSLIQFQNADALRQIGVQFNEPELVHLARQMSQAGINEFWRKDHFITAIDSHHLNNGEIDPPSTDSLNALVHIPATDIEPDYPQAIERFITQSELETERGYRTGRPVAEGLDPYHTEQVWTHEQALLHIAAQKHDLQRAQRISRLVFDHIDAKNGIFPETFNAETYTIDFNSRQLWAAAAHHYYQNPSATLF